MGCRSIKIEGIENITVNQGVDVDLMDGVHAYDSNLDEIDVSVSPSEIDSCDVGTHTVTYKATGIDDGQFGVTTCIEPLLHAPNLCNYRTIQKSRTIEVLSVDPPVISGIDDESIEVGGSLDLLSGVSAIDANGNTVDVSYSGEINELASGEIASFETDIAKPLQSLTVNLDPIQDLNGYDSPWVGGAGKNKVDVQDVSGSANQRYYVDHVTDYILQEGVTYTFSLDVASSLEPFNFSVGTGDNSSFRSDIYTEYNKFSGRHSLTFTPTAAQLANYNKFAFRAPRYSTLKDFTYSVKNVQLELGSTATSWTPYENICPISGHTEVDVVRTGKNLWGGVVMANGIKTAIPQAVLDTDAKTISYLSGYATPTSNFTSGVRFKENTQYTIILKFSNTVARTNMRIVYTDGTSSIVATSATGLQTITFVSSANKTINFIGGSNNDGTSVFYYEECGIFEGIITADQYTTYEGDTYTVTLPETVYGGTVDLVSGVLTVTYAIEDMGDLNWTSSLLNGVISFYVLLSGAKLPSSNGVKANILSSAYETDTANNIYTDATSGRFSLNTSGYIQVRNSNYSDASTFKTAMSGQTICYELATPTTYQLTPQQIQTLVGTNNVWSEQGSVAVVYARSIQNRSETFDVEGLYEITYTAEDKCGNERTSVRTITVGDLSSTE